MLMHLFLFSSWLLHCKKPAPKCSKNHFLYFKKVSKTQMAKESYANPYVRILYCVADAGMGKLEDIKWHWAACLQNVSWKPVLFYKSTLQPSPELPCKNMQRFFLKTVWMIHSLLNQNEQAATWPPENNLEEDRDRILLSIQSQNSLIWNH